MIMKKKFWKIFSILIIILLLAGGYVVYDWFFRTFDNPEPVFLLVDEDDDIDSVRTKVQELAQGVNMTAFNFFVAKGNYAENIHPGRYEINNRMSTRRLFTNLRNHETATVMMLIPEVRTLQQMAGRLSRQIMLDSLTLVRAFTDETSCKSVGFTPETMPALFIPDTYEMYWDVSAERLLKKLRQNYDSFWNKSRLQKAKDENLTPVEVATLASIVESETANNAEKPRVAGLYMNRLHKNMLLQSDPTVIFALQDFTIRRVLNKHLAVISPYNTYKNPGLPPGPIRIASATGIDAVLNYEHNDYIYMCAKEDFSGTHNFAVSSAEHAANARKYQQALNARGIK